MRLSIFFMIFLLIGCSRAGPELLQFSPRGAIPVTVLELQALGNFSRDGVEFPTTKTIVAADIYYPRTAPYALVWIPPAGKTKEDARDRGLAFGSRGLAALIMDVRGLGQTKGEPHSFEEDFIVFLNGGDPYHYLVIYDALRAVDALRERGYKCVFIGGESNGGRIALLAAAHDKTIPGVLLMSTAGFGTIDAPHDDVRRFMASINPDYYAPYVKTPVAFVHDTKDPTIPFSLAQQTYEKIRGPKKLLTIEKGCHGYCPAMSEALTISLDFLSLYCPK